MSIMTHTIATYLRQRAKRHPEKVAFRHGEKSITFGELDRKAVALAEKIHERLRGKTKQPIGVFLPKGVDAITAFMGVLYSGNFYTPLDVELPRARLEKILASLEPALILAGGRSLGGDRSAPLLSLEELSASGEGEAQVEALLGDVIDTDVLYVMFTSGSTGTPKGVVMTHRGVMDYVEWLGSVFHFDEGTVFGNQAPFYFDNSVLDIYCTLRYGCETVLIPEDRFLSGGRLCAFLGEKEISAIFWVPSAMALAANSGALGKYPLPRLKTILFAGEVMPTKILNLWRKALPQALYANLYGPTEIAVDCTYYIVDREFEDTESLPIGGPCRNTGILVLNGEDRPAAPGEIGELCVRGSCLAFGYYGEPEKTEKAFVQNPLQDKYPEKIYRTGDLVKYNERGELIFVGRKDTQIKHRGYRIELGELEAAASAIPEVTGACALYDGPGKRIVLFVTPEDLDEKAVYARLKDMLPHYMLPGLIVPREAFPHNQNGKVDRLSLGKQMEEMGSGQHG